MLKKFNTPKKKVKTPVFPCKRLKYNPKISTLRSVYKNSYTDCNTERVDITTINMASLPNPDIECIGGEICPTSLTPPPSQHPAAEEAVAMLTQQRTSTTATVIVPYDSNGDTADAAYAADTTSSPAADAASSPTADKTVSATCCSADNSESEDDGVKEEEEESCDFCNKAVKLTLTCSNCNKKACIMCSNLDKIYFTLFKVSTRKYSCVGCASDIIAKKPAIQAAVETEFKKRSKDKTHTKAGVQVKFADQTPTNELRGSNENENENEITKPQNTSQHEAGPSDNSTAQGANKEVAPKKPTDEKKPVNETKDKKQEICKFYKKKVCVKGNNKELHALLDIQEPADSSSKVHVVRATNALTYIQEFALPLKTILHVLMKTVPFTT